MATNYKFIPEITPTERNWQVKIIVAEKMSPKQARNSNNKYQNMVLMDFQGNKVHTTLYDGNITAFENELLLSKTYIISNAIVKDTKPEYKVLNGDFQWTITGKTRIKEVNENNMEFLFSTYIFTAFDQLGKYMDSNNDISILAAAIDMRPKRLIQTRYGNQTYVQDVVLIDKTFNTIILTMWDSYVDKECIVLAEKIAKKPIILANRLKVSSFNGLTLSTKINSTFFIDAAFEKVTKFRGWVEVHSQELNEFTLEKSLPVTPTKLSAPPHKKFTEIQNMKGRLLGRKYFWIKAKASIVARNQSFWYMSCINCNKVSHAEFGESFACIYCKYPSSKAVPRATTNVHLEDTTGMLIASAIGNPAEILLKSDAESLMHTSRLGNDVNIEELAHSEEHIFYVKVTQIEPNAAEYKYEVVFVLHPSSAIGNETEEPSDKDTSSAIDDETEQSSNKDKENLTSDSPSDIHDISPPSAKRLLYKTSTEGKAFTIDAEAKNDTFNSGNVDVRGKGKLE